MITIPRKTALRAIKNGRLPKYLVAKGITVVMEYQDGNNWLDALRGEYGAVNQAAGVLFNRQTKGFCCLGVEQSVNWGGKVEANADGEPQSMPSFEYLEQTGKMYFDHRGQRCLAPTLVRGADGVTVDAASANDNGWSFVAIADALECLIATYYNN